MIIAMLVFYGLVFFALGCQIGADNERRRRRR